MNTNTHICNEKFSWTLDNSVRRLLQPPTKIIDRFVKPGMKTLDLGCGPGYFTIPLAKITGQNGSVTAVDLQAGMLVKIQKKIKNTELENRIILHQSSEKGIGLLGQYDFALTFWMLHEVSDKKSFVHEIYGLIKNGGTWLFVEPKGHVVKPAFEKSVEMAMNTGFIIKEEPKMGFSRAVLFSKSQVEK